MQIRAFKYLSPILIYFGALTSFLNTGFVIWLPLFYSWFLVPLLELFIPAQDDNLSEAEEELAKRNRWYDVMLYAVVPFQYMAFALFIYQVGFVEHTWIDLMGKTFVMGLLCGVMGINVGHELGHRSRGFEKFLAKSLLLTSLYMHFFIEHNKGHHKRVATPEDPSSARMGEWLYAFYFRSIIFSYISAWKIAGKDARKTGRAVISIHNEMIQYHLVQAAFLTLIFLIAGWLPLLLFLVAAGQGILLLETVNYIEHYGLQRKALGEGRYERAMPHHSWNSNHVIGRVMLFELSRHSDHHYLASRKYQLLRHHYDSPQMPTGYPGMMILATLPPAWFYVMNHRVRMFDQAAVEVATTNENLQYHSQAEPEI